MRAMKRVVVNHFGGPEVLRVAQDDDPRPGPGEVRVRVLAAGVSFTDAQGSDSAADRRPGCGRGVGLVGWPDLAALVPGAAPGRQACRVRPLRHALARAQESAGGDRVVRLDR